MPIIFYVIIFMMYAGFYYYDRCLLQQDIFRMMIRGSQIQISSNEEVAQKIKEEDAKWYYEKYVLCNWADKEIEVSHGEIRVKQQAAMEVAIPRLVKWSGKEAWSLDVDIKSTRIHPTDTIRNCRKVEKVMERGEEDDGMGISSSDEP